MLRGGEGQKEEWRRGPHPRMHAGPGEGELRLKRKAGGAKQAAAEGTRPVAKIRR